MKLFRTIYYSVLGLLAVALLTLSCIDIAGASVQSTVFDTEAAVAHVSVMSDYSSGSVYDDIAQSAKKKYITDRLDDWGLDQVDVTERSGKYTTANDISIPSYASAEMVMTPAERKKLEAQIQGVDESDLAEMTEVAVTDIIVYLPANGTQPSSEVMLLTAHYDTTSYGPGANGNLGAVGALMETLRATVENDVVHNNDLLIVFTDGGAQGMYGAQLLKTKFSGFDQAYSRIKFAANFDARGTSGTSVLFETSGNNYNLIKNWSTIRSTMFASSAINAIDGIKDAVSDFNVLSDIPALNFTNVGGAENNATQNDKTPNETLVNNWGTMMTDLIGSFGSLDLDQLTSGADGVYFTYLDGGLVVYSSTVAYVLGAVIVLMVVAAMIVGALKKTMDLKSVFKGLAVQLLTITGCLLFALLAYYLIGSIVAACGVISIFALPTSAYSSMPLLIFSGLLVVAFGVFLTSLFRKVLKVKAGDIVRGNILLWTVLGAIISFAAPGLGYLFTWVALFEGFFMLMHALFKDMYRKRFGESMDKLTLYALPIVFLLPMFMGLYLLLGDLVGVSMYFLLTMFAVMYAGFVTPFFSALTPGLARVIAKLPAPSVRVVRTVTENVEDSVKKGKFKQQTYRKTTRERIPLQYRTWHGAVAMMCVSLLVVFCLMGGGNYSKTVSGYVNGDARYDDALMYVVDKTSDAPASYYWLVTDLDAYHYISRASSGFTWKDGFGYYKQDSQNLSKTDVMLPKIHNLTSTETTKSFTVASNVDGMLFSLKFKDASKISEVRVTTERNDGKSSGVMTYGTQGLSELTVSGLRSWADITIVLKVAGAYDTAVEFTGSQVDYSYDEDVEDKSAIREFEDAWAEVKEYYILQNDVKKNLKAGIAINGYSLAIAGSN